ncbi:UDP-N-acetylmuramate:L-alanyl-gamma-D-glutamyl-meso-diaminopimelate ligase [Bordetella genomosp. 13]|uniref:UDP-N-acetylmuramate--L-alanyl-gamma-D-glutamyl-meso-2,6-diaminoheptandioate ligase n=1 Tax=Bordetella genomosp. 13 TaxID=463040 RepID=A0A1W6ZH13_9BORD|nr:UDP-N-acetylmuramate:L-alanyl-gamma-D-glutamyl-meso-diaminopimelate ligase [Bordetella genomosp. 13]ARP96619.1 UDP-N-acetylmuramate:L-alanyl-gamma-D-glutamyl-meso-diaminopimelate ligase [Bordetella genomosp. 13]
MHLHILGICGTFMGGLALIARAAGHKVTGCDAGVYPPMSTQLSEQGIDLIEGFGAEQLALKPDLYVVGNVVSRGNPLMEAILDSGARYVSGPQWLGDHILPGRHVLAVAGTHGKTTTSSMLAWILEAAGLRPNFLIGGIAPDLQVSARFDPAVPTFVIEADEYDTAFFDKRSKFVHYRPRTAILNNLEYDHADIFPDLAAIETQFHHLVRTIPASGRIVAPASSEALDRVLARGCWSETVRFGPGGAWQAGEPDDNGAFAVLRDGREVGVLRWGLGGEHNRMNALAALAAAEHAGVPAEQGLAALSRFGGVKRRMELRGTVRDIKVYDDFAHHPTAIATTLEGLRRQVGDARILAVLEPRSNTMKLGTMAARLPESLQRADLVFCFGAREGKQALGWDPAQVLAPLGERAKSFDDLEALVAAVATAARPGDHVVVMSNGGFGGVHGKLLEALAK